MTLTLTDVFSGLAAVLQSGAGLTVIKGYPDWARTTASLPLGALELAAQAPVYASRLGQHAARREVAFRVYVFARHELELCDLLDAMQAFTDQQARFELNDQRVDLRLQSAERYTPEASVQQERHAFVYQYSTTWSA